MSVACSMHTHDVFILLWYVLLCARVFALLCPLFIDIITASTTEHHLPFFVLLVVMMLIVFLLYWWALPRWPDQRGVNNPGWAPPAWPWQEASFKPKTSMERNGTASACDDRNKHRQKMTTTSSSSSSASIIDRWIYRRLPDWLGCGAWRQCTRAQHDDTWYYSYCSAHTHTYCSYSTTYSVQYNTCIIMHRPLKKTLTTTCSSSQPIKWLFN